MKNCKKILSLTLSLLLVVTMFVPTFSASAGGETYPEIFVPGFDASVIYSDVNDKSSVIDVPEKEAVIELVKAEIVPALLIYAADQDAQKLGKCISDVLNNLFADWFNNPDGSAKENAGVDFVYPSKNAVINASSLRFAYDWRGDVIESAASLNDYINYVLECTGKDKVALTSHSLGGVVVLTYLALYGSDKVMGIVFDTPAIDGIESVGELFSDNADFEAEGVAALFKMIMGTTEYEELANSVVDILTMAGVNGSISDFLDNAYDKVGRVIFSETLVPLFGRWPSIWSMIPDEYIDSVMSDIFANELASEDYLGLKAKITNYNQKVRANKKQTLLDFDTVGRVAVISRYGYEGMFLTNKWDMISDTVVETQNSSLGATTAKVGESFSDEYLAGKDMKYISPDKTVDASTCLFPEKTWFVKNASHSQVSEVTTPNYYKQLLFSAEEATCENSGISRFMVYDSERGLITTDKSEPVKTEKPTIIDRIFNFIKALINKLLDLFRK